MNSQEILDDVGGLSLHLLNLLTKTIIFGGVAAHGATHFQK